MSLSTRWRRVDATRWVFRLCVLYAIMAGLVTVSTLFLGFALHAPWIVLLPAALTFLAGWVAHAWDHEQRWAWWALAVLSVADGAWELVGLSGTGLTFMRALRLLVDVATLALLFHPDSRERLEAPAAAACSSEVASGHGRSPR